MTGQEPIDYGQFVGQLRLAVEPVLDAYRLRDQILQGLQERGRPLKGSTVVLLVPGNGQPADPGSAGAATGAAATGAGAAGAVGATGASGAEAGSVAGAAAADSTATTGAPPSASMYATIVPTSTVSPS